MHQQVVKFVGAEFRNSELEALSLLEPQPLMLWQDGWYGWIGLSNWSRVSSNDFHCLPIVENSSRIVAFVTILEIETCQERQSAPMLEIVSF